jgi:hypothetical protein
MDNIPETTEPLPDLKPAADALFDENDPLDGPGDAESLLRMIFSDNTRFFELPLLERLHKCPYHLLRIRGAFDLKKLVRDHQAQLYRSESCDRPKAKKHIERLLFALGEGVFIVYDSPDLMVYAPTPQSAAKAAAEMKKYRKPERKKPAFKLISLEGSEPRAQLITVEQAAPVTEQDLALHYGEDFIEWERPWFGRLRQRRSGLTVLHGPPGCGKTSYLRGLMSRLLGKFEFYYLPVSSFDVLTSPSFVSFWLEQPGDRKMRIAILEDAEELLLPRDQGSQTDVSNLLNIGDGFLGEHLKLHVIATTNWPIRQLDPALLRPGRLLGTREFRRLTRLEAQRLAEMKGLALPDQNDFSLAEIYCCAVSGPVLKTDRKIGFVQ